MCRFRGVEGAKVAQLFISADRFAQMTATTIQRDNELVRHMSTIHMRKNNVFVTRPWTSRLVRMGSYVLVCSCVRMCMITDLMVASILVCPILPLVAMKSTSWASSIFFNSTTSARGERDVLFVVLHFVFH